MEIAERLQNKARRHGVDIKQALKVAGIHRSTWFRWRAGGNALTSKVVAVEKAIESLRLK